MESLGIQEELSLHKAVKLSKQPPELNWLKPANPKAYICHLLFARGQSSKIGRATDLK